MKMRESFRRSFRQNDESVHYRNEDNLTRECRRFYENRLRTLEKMKENAGWSEIVPGSTTSASSLSECDGYSSCSSNSDLASLEIIPGSSTLGSPKESPLESPQMSEKTGFDKAMTHLRSEIATLISQDNDLFRQLLALNDSIEELKAQRRRGRYLLSYDNQSEYEDLASMTGSYDSLCCDTSLTVDTSPTSTLSSASSTDVRPGIIAPQSPPKPNIPDRINKRAPTINGYNSNDSILTSEGSTPVPSSGERNRYNIASRGLMSPARTPPNLRILQLQPFYRAHGSIDSGLFSESEIEIFV